MAKTSPAPTGLQAARRARAGLLARLGIFACASSLAAPLPARAHAQSISYGDYQVRGAQVQARLRFAQGDFAAVLKLDQDGDGAVTQRDLDALGPALLAPTLGAIAVASGGAPCAESPGARAELDGKDGLVVTGSFSCPGAVARLSLHLGFIAQLPSGHTHLALVSFDGEAPMERLAQAGSETLAVEHQARLGATLARFFLLGVEHIFTGYDHIAFLIGLLLLGGTLRRMVGIISAFTVAHSITLALATLDVFAPPPSIIEPAIALSIVFVAGENLWALRRRAARTDGARDRAESALRHRWMITFAFGLIHGFGFASALRELNLPRAGLAASLVTFNLGVEAGQICIVALVWPGLLALRRRAALERKVALALSAVIAALGALWFVLRVA